MNKLNLDKNGMFDLGQDPSALGNDHQIGDRK